MPGVRLGLHALAQLPQLPRPGTVGAIRAKRLLEGFSGPAARRTDRGHSTPVPNHHIRLPAPLHVVQHLGEPAGCIGRSQLLHTIRLSDSTTARVQAMPSRTAIAALLMLFLATPPAKSDAKVLAQGEAVSEQPVTVIAIAPAYKPSRVALDVVPRPSVPARAEWIILCPQGPGPTTGGSFVTEGPAHRRLKLPRRPRGLCHVHVEAAFADPGQTGRIAVTVRGHVRKAPFPLLFGARTAP